MKTNLFAYIWAVANFVALQFPILRNNQVMAIILILFLASTIFLKTKLTKISFFICIFAISFFWSSHYAKKQIDLWLPVALENKSFVVEATIDELIKQANQNNLMIINLKHEQWRGRALLYVDNTWCLHNNIAIGQTWRMNLKLKRPHGFANPYAFKSELFYLESKIQAVATLQDKSSVVLLSISKPTLKTLRYSIQEKIFSLLSQSFTANFISALVLGHLQNFDWQQKQVLQKTGTSHLLAISGLHIGLVALSAHAIAKIIARRIPILFLYLPLPKIAAFSSVISILLYSLLSGFSLPTQRAFIMLTTILLARCFSRQIPKWHGFSLALFLVLLLDPLAIISSSFWLSFIAVVTIFLISDNVSQHPKWSQFLTWQLMLTLSLLPWTLYFFHAFSLISIPANLIAIPLIGYVIIPLSLLAIIFLAINTLLAKYLFLLASYFLKLLWSGLEILSDVNWAQWQSAHFSFFIFLVAVLSCLTICYSSFGIKRFFALFGLLPLFFLSPLHPKANQLFLYVLDVGQGLAIVVQTEKHTLLYDAGLKIQNKFDAGKTIIKPFLQQLGIKKIDRVVISHDDNDHSGGIKSISQYFLIKELLSSKHKNYISNVETRWCFNGEHWNWDGINFEFLHPNLKFLSDENNGSCVLKITNQNISILLPGDIEHDAEDFLVKNNAQKLSSQILISPHHGSRTSSTFKFLNTVNPRYIIISSGYLNRFHFPNFDVMQRYKNLNAKIFNTADVGAITIKIDKDKITEISAERIKHKKFWDK